MKFMKFKKLLAAGVLSLLILSAIPTNADASRFYDISGHWAAGYIRDMENAGVLGQFNTSSLQPDKPMTREECAVLISDFAQRYYGYKPDYAGNFSMFPDLPGGKNTDKINALGRIYFTSYMAGKPDDPIRRCNIIEGYPSADPNNKPFVPNAPVTRAEFSKMFYNAMDCFGYNAMGNYRRIPSDANLHWASTYIAGLYDSGILNGYNTYYGDYYYKQWEYDYNTNSLTGRIETENYSFGSYVEFKPDNLVTRAEAIKMVSQGRDMGYIGVNSEYTARRDGNYNLDNNLYHLRQRN